MNGLFNFVGMWFGYVGSCVVGPDATCRPFLAFLALGIAAAVALTVLLMWYRSGNRRTTAEVEDGRARARVQDIQARIRRRSVVQPARIQPIQPRPTRKLDRHLPLPV